MLVDRFIKYVKIDTQSDEESLAIPSTKKQLNLSRLLVEELHHLGVSNAELDDYGVVYAFIKAPNADEKTITIGLNAHVDTALETSGKDVKPQIIKNYAGNDITLNESLGIFLSPKEFPELLTLKGQDLIVTDGTTLLGADDKAGLAIIMEVVQAIMKNPDQLKVNLALAFTPDEEIGRGVANFDIKRFDATYAYTIDGGDINYANYENFNAASAVVRIQGKAIHPGSALGQMINASTVAMEFHALLDPLMVPEKTSGYEGFNHLNNIEGDVEQAELNYIIRNHDLAKLDQQKEQFIFAANTINKKYNKEIVKVEIIDSYRNMADLIKKDPRSLNRMEEAYKKLGLSLTYIPIRGGTDGAGLSYQGVLTPNLGTGGYNAHGKYEFVSINQMEKMVEIVLTMLSI